MEQKHIERDQQEREKTLQQEAWEQERQERERKKTQERQETQEEQEEQEIICINIKIWEEEFWKDLPTAIVNPADPVKLEQVTKDYLQQNLLVFNTMLYMLSLQECFQVVVNNQTFTVLLVPQDKNLSNNIWESASEIHAAAIKKKIGLKQIATDNIAWKYYKRKRLIVE